MGIAADRDKVVTSEPGAGVELLLFQTDPRAVVAAAAAGIDGCIVDWERRGKARRQAGEGTQINNDTLDDLRRVRSATDARVVCRVNGFGPWTRDEVRDAIDAGADEVLLPMVRRPEHVDAVLRMVAGRAGVGILIETVQGVMAASELCLRPLSRVYVGLNDLRIDRGSSELFRPLVDGTVDYVRACGEAPELLDEHINPLASAACRCSVVPSLLRRDTGGPTGPCRTVLGERRFLIPGSQLSD